MTEYRAPLEDIAFTLEEITSLERLAKLPEFVHADPESVRGALQECGRFVREVIAPLNELGDRQHSRRNDDGSVNTPHGFAAAYQQYVESVVTARFYCEQLLPQAAGLLPAVTTPPDAWLALDPALL